MPSQMSAKEKSRYRKLLYSVLEKLDNAMARKADSFINDRPFLSLTGEAEKPFSDKEKKTIDMQIEIFKQEALDILQKLQG